MKKLLREDLSWKILSLGLAMILWLFVINTQNPSQPQTIKNIPVTIKGLEELEEQGYVLKDEEEIKNQSFSITIRGPRLEVDKVYNNNLVRVTLNLNQYMSDLTQDSMQCLANYTVDILLDGDSITVTDKNPEFTSIVLEREASVTRFVDYHIMEGSTSEYELLAEPVINPTEIQIKGAKSAINEINEVVVNIDGNNFSEETLVKSLPVEIYDMEGNEISGLVTSPQTVEVRLLIGKFKEVPLKVNITGKPQEGYIHLGNKLSQQAITIVGKPEVVDKIKEIELEPIDISQITQTLVVPGKLKLPEGITTNNTHDINVTIEMDKENTYIYSIPTGILNIKVHGLAEHLNYEILTQEVPVSISATAQEARAYNVADIAAKLSAELDLSGYEKGEYTLPLKLQIADELKLLNNSVELQVKLVAIEQEEEVEIPEESTSPEEIKPEESMPPADIEE